MSAVSRPVSLSHREVFTIVAENMHDRPDERGSRDTSVIGSPSVGLASPLPPMPMLSDHQLSPLASPFENHPFRIPTYEGVDARPFSPPSLSNNFLGFQEFTPSY